MVRVPSAAGSLVAARADGADVRVVYSPQQALELAAAEPGRQVALIAVGFETTAPAVAAVARQALDAGLDNLSILCLHKTIPPALEALAASPDVRVDGLLCPGHVSVVIGSDAYLPLARRGMPCVVAGFEADDIMLGLAMLVAQLADGRADVENAYPRAVRAEGNRAALAMVASVFEVEDAGWRGLGAISGSGLGLRDGYRALDAIERFGLTAAEEPDPPGCRCGDVLRGVLRPAECPLFGEACVPERPVGPCMVSSEGACAAVHKYEVHAMPEGRAAG
jgi:hydrogenase expression/formation protein HypD